ncbi:MAG: TraB/GumN family protein [Nanobdellota archaeon]
MEEKERYVIVGTNHISKQSQQDIKQAVLTFKPDAIAVELDVRRAQSLDQPQAKKPRPRELIKHFGFKGFVFFSIASFFQKKLAKVAGVMPGVEMKYAMDFARRNSLELYYIDKPITVTIRSLFSTITWKEKWRLARYVLQALSPFKKRKKKISVPITQIPDASFITSLLNLLSTSFPSLYDVLIERRNKYMARKIVLFLKRNPSKKLLVVVGAGHVPGLKEHIASFSHSIEYIPSKT